MKRTASAVLTTIMLALGICVLAAPSAQAVAGCGGSLIGRKAITYSGTTIGELAVYYNASTGRNCARTNHLGPTYGVTRLTEATLVRCTQKTRQGDFCTEVGSTYVIDKDNYAYYAGPVSVYSPHNCVKATGVISWHGAWRTATWVGGC